MDKKEMTEVTIKQAGITMTVSVPIGADIDDLLDMFKQMTVGLGFADYGEATFTKLEEESNG